MVAPGSPTLPVRPGAGPRWCRPERRAARSRRRVRRSRMASAAAQSRDSRARRRSARSASTNGAMSSRGSRESWAAISPRQTIAPRRRGPGGGQRIRLVRVARPGLDRLFQGQDRPHRRLSVALVEGSVEDPVEFRHFVAQGPRAQTRPRAPLRLVPPARLQTSEPNPRPRPRARRSGMVVPAGKTTLRPSLRTVTTPNPSTEAVRASRSNTRAVCPSTPRTKTSGGQLGLQDPQPPLAQVAEARVVVAALGVVVVRDHGYRQAQRPQQVQARRASAAPRRPCRSRRPES